MSKVNGDYLKKKNDANERKAFLDKSLRDKECCKDELQGSFYHQNFVTKQ